MSDRPYTKVPYRAFGQEDDVDDFSSSQSRLRDVQNDVDEVVVVMRQNMEKVLDRGDALGELEDKSEALVAGAARFKSTSRTLKRRMWWQNIRWWVYLILILVIIIVVVVVVEVEKNKGGGGGSGSPPPPPPPPPPPTAPPSG